MRPLKLLVILSLSFLLNSCKTVAPEVTVCASDPSHNGADCFNQRTKESFFLPYLQTDKFVCMPPTDAQTLFDFCAQLNK